MSAKFEIGGDASGAVKAVQAYVKSLDDAEKASGKVVATSKKTEEAAKRLAAQADPQTRYNQQMEKLAEAVKHGGLEITKAETLAQRYQRTLDNAGKAGDEAFGPRALQNIGRIGLEIAGITSALSLAVRGFQEFRAEQEAAAARVSAGVGSFGELAQIAPSEEVFKRQVSLARDAMARGIVKAEDQSAAATLAFQLDSAGLSDSDKKFILDIGEGKIVSAENLAPLAGGVGQLQAAMGTAEAGDARAIVNKAVMAAAPTKANATQLAAETAKIAPGAKMLGLSDEELFGAMSDLTRVYGSASEAGTRMKALLGVIDKTGYDRDSFVGSIEAINADVSKGKKVRNLLGGNEEALAAFSVLSDTDRLRASISAVDQAQRDDPINERLRFLESDPQLLAGMRRQQAEGRLARTTDEQLSAAENLAAAARADMFNRWRTESPGLGTESAIFFERMGSELPVFGDPTRFLRSTQNGTAPIQDAKLNSEVVDLLKRIDQSTAGVDRTTKSKVATRAE